MEPTIQRLSFDFSKENTNTNEQSERPEYNPGPVDFFIPAIAEFIGSFLFTFLSIFSYLHTPNIQLAGSLIDGATSYIIVCSLGQFSGAHFNPAQTLSVIFVGKCRLAIGIFIIFMQFLGAFFGAVYGQCVMEENAFAVAMHVAMKWSSMNVHASSPLQYFVMELTLSALICCAYLFTGIISDGKNGSLCATVVAAARATVNFVGYSTVGQTANLARTIAFASASYIFLSISDKWRLVYIPIFANIISPFFAASIYWFD
uniref:Aquaporin n=1 Tax=Setaria digitata TaxID=48799 RepID=A0A915PY40_9BILA